MRGGKERREEVEDTEEKGGSGEEMEQSRERERVMFQNKGSTLNATPWPRPAWKGCDFCIKRPLGRTRPRGQAESLPQPLAGRAGSRLAARGVHSWPRAACRPAPRSPRAPTYLLSRRATWTDPRSRRPWRPLGLGRTDTSAHAHLAGWPGGRRTPPGRKCTGSPVRRERGDRKAAVAGGGGCKAAPHAEAREPDRLPSLWCLPRPAPATAWRQGSPDRRLHLPARRQDRPSLSSTLGLRFV